MLPTEIHGWAATRKGSELSRISRPIPALGDYDVLLRVQSCGVCHSDIHLIDNDWMISNYPLIPGHEIIGTVVGRGSKVSLPLEATVGVGWQRGSCLTCDECVGANENLCDASQATCVAHDGGYADYHVTDSRFAFELPKTLAAPQFAPLLCGGATVFSPLRNQIAARRGRAPRVGVVALGGLGHLAVKFAKAMGCEVSLFSSSPHKKGEAEKLGVDHFIDSKTPDSISAMGRRLDMVLVTGAYVLPWSSYLQTLRADGTLCFVGIPPAPLNIGAYELLNKQLRVTGSTIASRTTIREMLEFANENEIAADSEVFKMDQANEAIKKVREGKVRHRAVLVNH